MPGNIAAWFREGLVELKQLTFSVGMRRVLLAFLLFVVALLAHASVSELLVAYYNSIEVYPIGYDTSMLAKTIFVSGYILLLATISALKLLKIFSGDYSLAVIRGIVGLASVLITDFPELLILIIGLWNLYHLIVPKIEWLVIFVSLLLFITVVFDVFPSHVPPSWCKYELTIMPCM